MTSVVNVVQYILPVLAVSIAVILLCFYHYVKKRRGSYDVTVLPVHDQCEPTVPFPEDRAEMVVFYDRLPPRYSTVDHPPPYSLFDPKLTNAWPGGTHPAKDMYPIILPRAPHHWTSDPVDHNPLSSTSQPQRHRQASAT